MNLVARSLPSLIHSDPHSHLSHTPSDSAGSVGQTLKIHTAVTARIVAHAHVRGHKISYRVSTTEKRPGDVMLTAPTAKRKGSTGSTTALHYMCYIMGNGMG